MRLNHLGFVVQLTLMFLNIMRVYVSGGGGGGEVTMLQLILRLVIKAIFGGRGVIMIQLILTLVIKAIFGGWGSNFFDSAYLDACSKGYLSGGGGGG